MALHLLLLVDIKSILFVKEHCLFIGKSKGDEVQPLFLTPFSPYWLLGLLKLIKQVTVKVGIFRYCNKFF